MNRYSFYSQLKVLFGYALTQHQNKYLSWKQSLLTRIQSSRSCFGGSMSGGSRFFYNSEMIHRSHELQIWWIKVNSELRIHWNNGIFRPVGTQIILSDQNVLLMIDDAVIVSLGKNDNENLIRDGQKRGFKKWSTAQRSTEVIHRSLELLTR